MTYLSRGGRRRRGTGVTSLVLTPLEATFPSCQLQRTSNAAAGENKVLRKANQNRKKRKKQTIKLRDGRTEQAKEGNLSSAESRATVTEGCCLTASVSPTGRPVGLACQHRLVRCRVRRAARRNVHTHTRGRARPKRCIQGTANVCPCDLYITTEL